jgi:hypothetical protein
LFLSNEIAGVIAEQNRQQFRFVVDDLEEMRTKVVNPAGYCWMICGNLDKKAVDCVTRMAIRWN